MSKAKRKPEKVKFTSITIPAEIAAHRKVSGLDKFIISDIGYFVKTGREYKFKYETMAKKFGVSWKAVQNAMARLKSAGKVIDTGRDGYHHNLHLNPELSSYFKPTGKVVAEPVPEPAKKFQKPTPEQAAEYAISIGFVLDGQHFIDYYEARGWKYKGGVKMKDWKAAVRTWKARQNNDGSSKTQQYSEPAGAFIR